MAYDEQNIFARIIRGEIPAKKLYEDMHVLAIADINPQAPQHILILPKGPYRDFQHFASQGGAEEIVAYIRAIADITVQTGAEKGGFRLMTNNGANAHQEVGHLHFHLLAGRPLGPLLAPPPRLSQSSDDP
jgi:histidine triad (HIT) family protein